MYWCTIKEEYINYLKQFEPRTPHINYGEDKLKPFFAPLFKVDELVYIAQVTSPKPRHYKMRNQMDFIKYYSEDGKLWGAINLNYMFPAPIEQVTPLTNKNIDTFKNFESLQQKSSYIKFLDLQLKSIEKLHIDDKAIALYKHCQAHPDDKITQRCFNFKNLELKCHEFIKSHQQEIKPHKIGGR